MSVENLWWTGHSSMIMSVHENERWAMHVLVRNIIEETGINHPSTRVDKVIERYRQGLLRATDTQAYRYFDRWAERYQKIQATIQRVRKAVYAFDTDKDTIWQI